MNQEPYLYHHGVKGMKWGVRKKNIINNNTKYSRKGYDVKNPRSNANITKIKNIVKRYDPKKTEDHGIKGTKWGVRKQRVLKGRSSGSSRKKISTKQRKEKIKTAAKISGTIAISLGLAFVASEMKRGAEFNKLSSSMSDAVHRDVQNIVSQHKNLKKLF